MTETMLLVGLAMVGASVMPAPRFRRVGGLRFIRWGRFQASWCLVRGEG